MFVSITMILCLKHLWGGVTSKECENVNYEQMKMYFFEQPKARAWINTNVTLNTNTRELQKLPVYIKILASVMRRELGYNLITEVIKQITGSRHKQVIKARIN